MSWVKFRDDVTGIGSFLSSHTQTPLDESQQWLVMNQKEKTCSLLTDWQFTCMDTQQIEDYSTSMKLPNKLEPMGNTQDEDTHASLYLRPSCTSGDGDMHMWECQKKLLELEINHKGEQ